MVLCASVAALAASDPQLAPVGVALMGSVVPAAASLAALDFQQAPAGVALVCCRWSLGHQEYCCLVHLRAPNVSPGK